jgi:hypothetical protein
MDHLVLAAPLKKCRNKLDGGHGAHKSARVRSAAGGELHDHSAAHGNIRTGTGTGKRNLRLLSKSTTSRQCGKNLEGVREYKKWGGVTPLKLQMLVATG